MKIIKVPEVRWALGDPEQATVSGVTKTVRPLYYNVAGRMMRVGSINPDYTETLMTALEKKR